MGVSFGLVYGLNTPEFKSSATYKKITTFKFTPIVMDIFCCLHILHSSFLMSGACLGVISKTPRASSLYLHPQVHFQVLQEGEQIQPHKLTAPTQQPIPTSNSVFCFLFQGVFLLNRKDFLAWRIICISSSLSFFLYFKP